MFLQINKMNNLNFKMGKDVWRNLQKAFQGSGNRNNQSLHMKLYQD